MTDDTRPRLSVNWEEGPIRARTRESALAAGVLHLALLVMVLLSPQFLTGGRLVAAELPTRQPDLTVLYLPNESLPVPTPQTPSDLTEEERKRAAVRSPLTLDPRELERSLPKPQPVPLTPPLLTMPPNTPPAASERPSNPAKQDSAPLSSGTEIARLEDLPKPERKPGSALELPLKSPGRAIEESLRQSQGQSGGAGGGSGVEGPLQPNLNTPFPIILSDTRGVDFGPYLVRMLREVRRNWYAVIPESARLGEKGKAVIVFTINKDGSVPLGQPTLVYSSGRSHLDRPAQASIRASQPFPPLPAEFTGPNLVLQVTFLYNLPLEYTGP